MGRWGSKCALRIVAYALKEEFIMNILVLVIALVIAQIVTGVVMMALIMNPRVLKWFMRKYMKTVNEVSNYLIEEDLV